jgi:hypothetical protein
MQTRGPGQSSNETEPCGQAHPVPVQTRSASTSLSQLVSQHWSVVGGGRLQGHPSVETYPDGQAQPDSVQTGSAGWPPIARPLHGSVPWKHRSADGVSQGLLQLAPDETRRTAIAVHQNVRVGHPSCIVLPPPARRTMRRILGPPAPG